MTIRLFILYIFYAILITSCTTSSNSSKAMTDQNDIEYIYADGSGNQYVIKGNYFKYDPIEPHESSSGIYSGGEPVEKKISGEQQKQLAELFQKAMEAQNDHQIDRTKGSGLVRINSKEETKKIILKFRSDTQQILEQFLTKLK